ncbi:MAG: hypothetical protein ACXWIT_25125, partial [Burkholderiales bacterium]
LDLGLLQMEVDGRPDGTRPYGFASLLDYHLEDLRRYRERRGNDAGWRLTAEEANKLRLEGLQFYHRYLSFFFLGDWVGVVRDTERNLSMFDILWQYGPDDDRWSSEQYRPYVLMMNTRARVSLSLQEKDFDLALKLVHSDERNVVGCKRARDVEHRAVTAENDCQISARAELFEREDRIGTVSDMGGGEAIEQHLDVAFAQKASELQQGSGDLGAFVLADERDRFEGLLHCFALNHKPKRQPLPRTRLRTRVNAELSFAFSTLGFEW